VLGGMLFILLTQSSSAGWSPVSSAWESSFREDTAVSDRQTDAGGLNVSDMLLSQSSAASPSPALLPSYGKPSAGTEATWSEEPTLGLVDFRSAGSAQPASRELRPEPAMVRYIARAGTRDFGRQPDWCHVRAPSWKQPNPGARGDDGGDRESTVRQLPIAIPSARSGQ
jgi:hypothetical protein